MTHRRLFSAMLAIAFAILAGRYFAAQYAVWVVLAALVVSQTTQGTPARQGWLAIFMMAAGLIASASLLEGVQQPLWAAVICLAIVTVCASMVYWKAPLSVISVYQWYLLPIVMLTVIFIFSRTQHDLVKVLSAICVGGFIGMTFSLLVLPVMPSAEFKAGLLPTLRVLRDATSALCDAAVSQNTEDKMLRSAFIAMENMIATRQYHYPEWVFEFGFNYGLRAGFRFFLIQMDKVGDQLFAMHYLFIHKMDVSLLSEIAEDVANALQKNQELLEVLISYFTNGKIGETQSDFTHDITELKNSLRSVVPDYAEWLDISPDYINLTAFVRGIQDIREMLLQLVIALPGGE